MIEKFDDYLGQLPLTKVIKTRITEVLELNSKIISDEIQDIYLCDLVNQEGSRTYTSLWIFTSKVCVECKNFLNVNDFDCTPYAKSVKYCSIKSSNYNFEKSEEDSQLTAYFRLKGEINGTLIGTGVNCEKAFDIYRTRIIPNIKE